MLQLYLQYKFYILKFKLFIIVQLKQYNVHVILLINISVLLSLFLQTTVFL